METVLKLFPIFLSAWALRAEDAQAYAWMASDLLGQQTWSMVVKIENLAKPSSYPPTVYALLFELDKILWFYTATDGTQSLSLYRNRIERDKSDLGLLFLAIDRGFVHWQSITRDTNAPLPAGRIPNGCFLESLALLRRRVETGGSAPDACLLSYYAEIDGRIRGHTVLAFRQGHRVCVIDPEDPARVLRLRQSQIEDPLSIAAELHPRVVSAPRVRTIPLGDFAAKPSNYVMRPPPLRG